MAHKLLGVCELKSIEREHIGYERANFNRPLRCVEVIRGESSIVLPTLNLTEKPSLAWFDYDGSISVSVLADMAHLVTRCAAGSILIFTINAKRDELPSKDENGLPIDPETSLRALAGDLVPTPLPPRRLLPTHYPRLLREILMNQLRSRVVASGRAETFVPLFDLAYSDGTPMITVGGMLVSQALMPTIQTMVSDPGWEGVVEGTISIPPLTSKERAALDVLMPCAIPPTPDELREQAGFALLAEQIRTYHRYYKHYPAYGELL